MSEVNYLRDVQPREGEGITDAAIAELITLDDTRYIAQTLTVEQIAAKLVSRGKDGPGIVNSILAAMDTVAAGNRIVQNKLDQLDKPGGTVDLGSPLQRKMLSDFAAAGLVPADDVAELLSLVSVIDPVTVADVDAARQAYNAAQAKELVLTEYRSAHSAHVVPVLDSDAPTTAELVSALRAAADQLEAG